MRVMSKTHGPHYRIPKTIKLHPFGLDFYLLHVGDNHQPNPPKPKTQCQIAREAARLAASEASRAAPAIAGTATATTTDETAGVEMIGIGDRTTTATEQTATAAGEIETTVTTGTDEAEMTTASAPGRR